jgi:preprotein translocase subunit SecE
MAKAIAFLKEAQAELMKVNWPTRTEVLKYTELVVAISLAIALFLGLLDLLFSWLVETFIFRNI